ncbi:hypothetical protein B0F90DRAFT_1770582 [Multifurca ochricompacta]|uniref:BRCT domain-containing protein n=1 Tax=Multifurca ochricompacta TaxID=376703 RepID=A0AAD4QIC9_9AGAM|nr:hypothetical protein B0F90DRAFT_1770582 [Multifurca ochricompacta]
MSIFNGINFFCSSTLSEKRKDELTLLLKHNGAQPAPLEEATHVITLSLDYEGQDHAKEGCVAVTDYWVDRSLILGKLQLVHHFSPDPAMLFSGVVACATDLVPSDVEVLSAGFTALGGQWRAGLTRDVTHLFAIGPGSEKYQTAMRYHKETQVKVLVPHWFDDSVRLGLRGLSTAAYEWPDPPILTFGKPSPEIGEVGDSILRPQNKLSQDKKALYKAVLMTAEQEARLGQAEPRDIWGHRRILLSPDLELSDGRKKAIEAGIVRSGGVAVEYDAKSTDSEYNFDVLIARYRWGDLYVQGVNGRKVIGSLTWLFHVESTGTIGTPTAQLLHYPIPKNRLKGFWPMCEITVTNYTGDARDYLKKLIGLMGATSRRVSNISFLIYSISGNKATKARNWSIPVVNHTWLEDCFIQWKNLSVGLEKYIVFPPGLDFSDHLGERGIQREVILESLPNLIVEMAYGQDMATPMEEGPDHREGGNSPLANVNNPGPRTDKDVEHTIGGLDREERMNVQSQPKEAQGVGEKDQGRTAPREAAQKSEPKRVRRSPRRASAGSSPFRQLISPFQRTYEGPSSARKRRHGADPETTEEEEVSSPTKKSARSKFTTADSPVRTPSKAPQKSPLRSRPVTPLRMESVLMPPIGTGGALGRSPQRSTKKTSPTKVKPKSHGSQSELTSSGHRRPLSPLTVDTTMDRGEGSSRQASRRSAATKASQRLRDEVMPDVVNFEKEMRRGHVRAANILEPKQQGREKTNAGSKAVVAKGKKRASIPHAADTPASSDDEHKRKKRRLSGVKRKDRPAGARDDERADRVGASSQGTAEIPSSKVGMKGTKVKKAPSGEDSRPVEVIPSEKSVGVLATQVTLDENEEKALAKLGAKVGVKPDECTHLIVKTLARTEKLLCAMAVAPAVVTEKWVRDSIAVKKLLPADKYVLVDPASENKWKFKLTDALKRAKANKGQLFAGKVFYVTNKVPLDKKLLKNVVLAHGGQIRHQNPTVRALSGKVSGDHYVISSPEDSSIWRPIAEAGHPIYSHELILSAALTQEIRLNDEDSRID